MSCSSGRWQSRTSKEMLPFLLTCSPPPPLPKGRGAEHWAHRRAPLRIGFSRVVEEGSREWGLTGEPLHALFTFLRDYLALHLLLPFPLRMSSC
jgi:hypothetical protein